MTLQRPARLARVSWRALAAALAAAALTAPVLAQDAAPAAPATAAAAAVAGVPAWGIASSELRADPEVRFGRLDNGMRYAIRRHEMPQDGASIRFAFDVGAREEEDEEIGAAHFLEHMAFNGSTNIPEGELIPRLERLGLAFGPDTNAETGMEHTTYKLDLPKTDAATMDAALEMMREVASELTIALEAVDRERGIILSESQARNTPQRRRGADVVTALIPGNRMGARIAVPPEAIGGITADELRGFYHGYYRPERATLAIVGDFDPLEIEAKIERVFADWRASGEARESYAPPVRPPATPRIATFVDPATAEVLELHHVSAYRPPLNTFADHRRTLLEAVAMLALNNRVAALTRDPETPILGGQAAVQPLFRSAESIGLMVVAKDGQWQAALALAEQELRRAREHGFTDDEVTEAKANFATSLANAVAQAPGRQSAALAEMLTVASLSDSVPLSPEGQLALYRGIVDTLTPATVNEAFRAAWPGRPSAVHLSSKAPIEEAAVAAALAQSAQVAVAAPAEATAAVFAYDTFGPTGKVASDARIADLGIRTVAFANGTRLNLKKTDFEPGSVAFLMLAGAGTRIFPEDKPGLPVMLQTMMSEDGLEAHPADELRRLLAGRQVSLGLSTSEEALQSGGLTTPADLELQLKLLAARLTATAYRPETQAQWAAAAPVLARNIAANPLTLLLTALNYEIAGDDGRAGFADPSALEKVTLQDLRAAIEPQLSGGPVEVALVGDFDEDAAIAAFAKTLGALPPRPAPTSATAGAPFAFTQDRSPRRIEHEGAADQGMMAVSWPTTDGRDLRSALTRELLAAVMQLRLIEKLREELGAIYSPQTTSYAPPIADGFGHLTAMVPAAPDKAELIARTIGEIVAELRAEPVSDDLILRARQPMLEQYREQLRQNLGWAGIVARAQSKPDLLDRRRQRAAVLEAVTAADVQAAAREFLAGEPLVTQVMPKE